MVFWQAELERKVRSVHEDIVNHVSILNVNIISQ